MNHSTLAFRRGSRRIPLTPWLLTAVTSWLAPLHGQDVPPTDLLMAFLDRDGDGAVEPYEGAEAFLWLASAADADGDGRLGQSELETFLRSEHGEERDERRALFSQLDADGDGRLTLATLSDDSRAFVSVADADSDGVITFDELRTANLDDPAAQIEQEFAMIFAEADRDGDDTITLDDLPAEDQDEFRDDFVELDVDGDGGLSRQEFLVLAEDEARGATFEVEGHEAIMTGVIGPSTPGRVLELRLTHPEVDTLVLLDAPGSMDDESNLRAARYVRSFGYRTVVPGDGVVASGGTDLFLAGVTRIAEPGARLGVHSWGGPEGGGDHVPRDDPAHRLYLNYYDEMGIPGAFYWYTLEVAGPDDIHWMTAEEIAKYHVTTVPFEGTRSSNRPRESDAYGLEAIKIPAGGRGIVPLPDSVSPAIRAVFDRYARVETPSGRPIHILAQRSWTEDQIVHVRNVLKHLLSDAPGTRYGADKSDVAEAMADRRATMVLFDDVDAMEAALQGPLGRLDLGMQDLRANECPATGSADYLRHETRDAAFEEILHLVHDDGIRPARPEYDALIGRASRAAADKGIWEPWPEDEPDSHRNEYIAAAYDDYLDLWTVPPTRYEGEPIRPGDIPAGTSHFGAFRAGSRARLAELDPRGFELVEMFLPPELTYTARLPEGFTGTFHLDVVPALRYTAKSQHLDDVALRGTRDASLVGNERTNTLTGNAGDNVLEGRGGDDMLIGGAGDDTVVERGERADYTITRSTGALLITDRVEGRDGRDTLVNIEHVRFADGTVNAHEP